MQTPPLPPGISLQHQGKQGTLTADAHSPARIALLMLMVLLPLSIGLLALAGVWAFTNAHYALVAVVQAICVFFALPLLRMSWGGKVVLTGNAQGCTIEEKGLGISRQYAFEWIKVARINDSARAKGTKGRFAKGTQELGIHIHLRKAPPIAFGWGYLSQAQQEAIQQWLLAHMHYKSPASEGGAES